MILSSLLFNTVLQVALKDDFPRWQKKKGIGTCLGENDHDCLTNLRFADDVLQFAATKEQLQKMLCDFKHSTEKVGLKILPGKTKILSSHSSNSRKEIEIDNIKVEILTKEESTKYLGQVVTFQQKEMGDVLQIQTRAELEIVFLSTSASLIRHGDHPNDEHERMIQPTQRKMLRLIIQTKRRYKKKTRSKIENKAKEEIGKLEKMEDGKEHEENQRSSENETDDGHSSNTNCDQNSDISFMNDSDEEIDTAEIEEDWNENMKRSTEEAMERMKLQKSNAGSKLTEE